MNDKLLTENGWKAIATKFKMKDNGLQRALGAYEKLEENKHDERLKAIGLVCQLANTLKKAKEVVDNAEVVKYLTGVVDAGEDEKDEITKAKLEAAKTAAMNQKKAEADAKNGEKENNEEEEDEEEESDYDVKLLAVLQRLKSSKGLSYQFMVCDAKPRIGVMVAKKINTKHKEELTRITGGGKRFLKVGWCRVENGKYIFEMDKPPSGLARKIQESIKFFTSKKLPIMVGTETAEDEEEQPGTEQGKGQDAAPPPPPALAEAPNFWHRTRGDIEKSVGELKAAIRKEFADEGPQLIGEIEKNMVKLDGILDKLDKKLADSLTKAGDAKDPGARKTELSQSKAILADYIKYIKSEPLIAHIDSNPFGVKTNLKQRLADSLTHMAKAIG